MNQEAMSALDPGYDFCPDHGRRLLLGVILTAMIMVLPPGELF